MPRRASAIWIVRASVATLLIAAAVARVLLAENKSEAIDGTVAIFLGTAFVILAIPWERLKTLRAGGVEIDLAELKESQRVLEEVTTDVASIVSRVEEALIPIIGGTNPHQVRDLGDRQLVIGSKDFREQLLLGHLLAEWIDKKVEGVTCERRIPNGGTVKNWADLTNGWIDGYVEYTGTGGLLLQKDFRDIDRDQALSQLNEESAAQGLKVKWLAPLGNTNAYAIAMRADTANELKITKLSDLGEKTFSRSAEEGKVVFCCQMEFYQRSDGLPRLQREHRFKFSQTKIVSYSERYRLLENGESQLTAAFGTDPELQDLIRRGVVIELEDDKKFFPEYAAVVAFNEDAFAIEGLEKAINGLEDHLNGKESELLGLIERLDEEGKRRRRVGDEEYFAELVEEIME